MNDCLFQAPVVRSRRSGTVYLLVLAAGMILAAISVSMLTLSQMSVRQAAMDDDAAEASVLAESAVEYALGIMATDPNWRTKYTSGVLTSPRSLGRGTISFKLVDEIDANLSNNTTDPVRLYGVGRVRRAARVYSVLCGAKPLSSLTAAVSCGGSVYLTSVTITGSATISSNGDIACWGASLDKTNLQASGNIYTVFTTGGGELASDLPAKELPNPSTVFDYYVANGTRMSNVSTSGGSGYQITRVLISPASNPFSGGTNPKGIYYIDCGGKTVTITSARIVGTLVLRNCGGVVLEGSLNCEPAVRGYPVLMVQGDLTWRTNTTLLSENTSPTVNFNPPSTPYPYNYGSGGSSDADSSDSYPTQVAGLVYVSGALSTSNSPVLNRGVVITPGGWSPSGSINLTFDDTCYNNPPPGFFSTAMGPVPRTWRQEAAP